MDTALPWKEILDQIRDFEPVMIRGFPSIVAELAQVMIDICGRQHRRQARVAGCKRSRVALPDGRTVYFGSDTYDDLWYECDMFKQIQFEQACIDVLNIRVVPFPETNRPRLKSFIQEHV